MAGYQFFHVETFAGIPSRYHKKQSARGVAKEAERYPEACLHVANPQPYKLMFGCTPSEAVTLAEARAALATDKLGRKLRKDAQIILCGVASYPVPMSELRPNDKALNHWLKLNYKFLRKKYGNRLKSIVAHTDEPYFHIHFYITPDFDDPQTKRLNIGQVHDGIRARNLVGGNKAKEKMRAYKKAMRALQDEYYEYVGKLCGLTRQGANKRRLTRSEWKVEQSVAERLASSLKTVSEVENRVNALDSEQKDLLQERKRLLKKESELIALSEDADKKLEKTKTEKKALINLTAGKDSVVKYLKAKVDEMKGQVIKLLNNISHLKSENNKLTKEVNTLVRVNEKLTYQNELRANALKRDRNEMFELVNLVATGNTNEVIEKYHNNKYKEYTL